MTQQYVGTKIVTAWSQAKEGKEGYAVKYADGYISWSPKEVFEESYLAIGHTQGLRPWHERLVAEQLQLSDKLQKLSEYLSLKGDELPVDSFLQLEKQAKIMEDYYNILQERLDCIIPE
mgnify:CR=1 FL=1